MASDDESELLDTGIDEEPEYDDDDDSDVESEDMTQYDNASVEEMNEEPEEDEEDIKEHPYQTKFKDELRNEYIQKYHPEEIHKPFEEIHKLSLIKRDENGTIVDPLHTTYPILSKYEKTKIIGLRISQLNKGCEPFVTINKHIIDNVLIAEKELLEKKLPFIIMRPIPNGTCEYWNVNDLEYI